jgi:hypothetical protein
MSDVESLCVRDVCDACLGKDEHNHTHVRLYLTNVLWCFLCLATLVLNAILVVGEGSKDLTRAAFCVSTVFFTLSLVIYKCMPNLFRLWKSVLLVHGSMCAYYLGVLITSVSVIGIIVCVSFILF